MDKQMATLNVHNVQQKMEPLHRVQVHLARIRVGRWKYVIFSSPELRLYSPPNLSCTCTRRARDRDHGTTVVVAVSILVLRSRPSKDERLGAYNIQADPRSRSLTLIVGQLYDLCIVWAFFRRCSATRPLCYYWACNTTAIRSGQQTATSADRIPLLIRSNHAS